MAGAKPYHQAYQRGVTHRQIVKDLIRKSRDIERSVLAQAVRWHLEHRGLVYGNKDCGV